MCGHQRYALSMKCRQHIRKLKMKDQYHLYIWNRIGPRTEPCDTPAILFAKSKIYHSELLFVFCYEGSHKIDDTLDV